MTTATNPDLPIVDGYTIEELIDRGGFSRVYRATQHGLDRPVAIKILNTTFEDERQRAVFERECRVMGRLSTHPNIVTVFASAITDDGRPAIVMELYAGTFRRVGSLSVAEVVDVGIKIADALQAIHDDGIIHRDIKPHNVFVSDRGEPAVGDFGISSIENERTVTGAAGFSINYAPPEVFEDDGAGTAGDIYSLGATLYHLIAGDVPFPHTGDESDRMRSTVSKIIASPPPSLGQPDVPPQLDRLIRRCMAKAPADRPTDANTVAQQLRALQPAVGFPDRRSASSPNRVAPRTDGDRPGSDIVDPTVQRRLTTISQGSPGRVVPDDDDRFSADPTRAGSAIDRRRLLLGAVGILTLVIAGTTVAIIGKGPTAETTPTVVTTTPPARDFVSLRPPIDVVVQRRSDRAFEIDWTVDDPDLKYQILAVGTSENRIVDRPPYVWKTDDENPESATCFQIRTLNQSETRASQAASSPTCAT